VERDERLTLASRPVDGLVGQHAVAQFPVRGPPFRPVVGRDAQQAVPGRDEQAVAGQDAVFVGSDRDYLRGGS
jgi:hypothetical protein